MLRTTVTQILVRTGDHSVAADAGQSYTQAFCGLAGCGPPLRERQRGWLDWQQPSPPLAAFMA